MKKNLEVRTDQKKGDTPRQDIAKSKKNRTVTQLQLLKISIVYRDQDQNQNFVYSMEIALTGLQNNNQ